MKKKSINYYFKTILENADSKMVQLLHNAHKVMVYVAFVSNALYMSFDRFLLAVESRDLSQADKNIISVSSFPS